MTPSSFRTCGAALLAVLFIGCFGRPGTTVAQPGPAGWPGESWPRATPAEVGIDPDAVAALHADIEAGLYGLVDHFLLIRHGRLVADEHYTHDYAAIAAAYDTTEHQYNYDHPTWHPYYQGTDLHTLQSVTKSVTSAALGIAIDEGLIEGVRVPVMPFLDAYEPDLSDARRAALTLEDLLTMRSGISWETAGGYSGDTHSTIVMELSDNWIRYVLGRPMDAEPGTVYQYNDGASVLIGKILREATGRPADQWAAERLFQPLGITDYYWKITPDGEVDTEGGLYLKPHDLARIGYLFLRDGVWDGEQIVSKDWVRASTAPVVADIRPGNNRQDPGYGYQWWVSDQADGRALIFAGNGYGGQFVLVAPAYDIVAVFNGWNIHGGAQRSTYRALQERILPATQQ